MEKGILTGSKLFVCRWVVSYKEAMQKRLKIVLKLK